MPLIKVLVVDDDPMVQQVNQDYVESVAGFRVVATARTGREALAAVQSHRPDLVLLDIYMPDQDGVTVLKAIRRLEFPADVLVVSAAQDAQTIRDVVRYGAVDYIIKPFRIERLQKALESYRTTKVKLALTNTLNQEQVDRVLRGTAAQPEGELPKGLNYATLRQVEAYVAGRSEASSAVEAANELGMARVTARRYLDYLVKLGRARLEVQYGSVGRPVNRYRRV
ncbi:MAG TPA: response regulator [Symbiobacteriaceae bacterium]|jgi:two-component system response regulator DctR